MEQSPHLEGLLHRYDRVLDPGGAQGSGHHDYIPAPTSLFMAEMQALGRGDGRVFLDVGVGLGRTAFLAYSMGWIVTGFDWHEPYVAVARQLVPEAELVVADAREWPHYAAADLVYLYQPLVADADERALEAKVVGDMSPGALLFLPCRTLPQELVPLSAHVGRKE